MAKQFLEAGLKASPFAQLLDVEKDQWLLILTQHSRTTLSESSSSDFQSSGLANPIGFHFSYIITSDVHLRCHKNALD